MKIPLSDEPQVVYCQNVPRDITQISAALRRSIRSVVIGREPWPLFIHGPPGTGKTCAALCLLDHSSGFYRTVAALCTELIDAEQGRLASPHPASSARIYPSDIWLAVKLARLVVLDEIGARERVSDHHYGAVQRILDDRIGKPLVCISNLGPDRIASIYDDRILSRLVAGTVVEVAGKDSRIAR